MKKLKLLITAVCFLIVGCDEKSQNIIEGGNSYCLNAKANCNQLKKELSIEILTNVEQVKPEHPFTILLSLSDIEQVRKVTGSLEGVSMYMGKVPLLFEFDNNSSKYRADAFVGSCSDPNMHWRVVVDVQIVDEAGELRKIQFIDNFYSQR